MWKERTMKLLISGLLMICLAQGVAAQTTDPVPAPLSQEGLEQALEIEPMQCDGETIAFDCVTDYLNDINVNLPERINNSMLAIRAKLEQLENAENEFDDLIAMALGVGELSKEGGPLSREIDRIGALIEKYEAEATANPKTADLAPLFRAEYERWQAVRERLLSVRSRALDVADKLHGVKQRGVLLLRLKRAREAINEAETAVADMSNIVDALQRVSDETKRELNVGSASD